ncbi:TRAP transporter permease [Dehalogenimonas etheniformans]|nr:TRAP transporter fused permease subunit [Dehalogenimonas etheniformans]QNT76696.1 TRAP transporter fused permease subunit [Dehalogenimonas etheniformans]
MTEPRQGGLSRYHYMPKPVKVIFLLAPVIASTLFVIHWFSIPIFGHILAGTIYSYLLYAILGFNIFIGLGATKKQNRQAPPWYDYILGVTLVGIIIFFMFNINDITYHNWDSPPNNWVFASAVTISLLVIEAGRRVGGWGLAALLVFSIIYPLFSSSHFLATHFGGVFYGASFPFKEIVSSFAFGANGMLGIPAQMLGELILGFFLFAGLIMGMGGGSFFMNLATSLMGKVRGGQAKVAVLASGFFGSITGSAMANIAGTGSFTIPAMKKSGFEAEDAAAIEACASSGSDSMPPVLGGLIFFMVAIFGVDYADVVIAAFLPSVLFYLGLLVQVDGYAARNNLKGSNGEDLPKWWRVIRDGWVYIAGLGVLAFGLVYMRWGAITPVYATGVVIALQLFQWAVRRISPKKQGQSPIKTNFGGAWKSVETGLVQTAGLVNYVVAIFIGMGLILVGLLKTGVAAGLAAWIISLGGDNLYLILFICLGFCVVMGTFGLERTAYIFLAIIAVPAIMTLSKTAPEFQAAGGLSIIGLNLFIISYSNLGGITPPVALNAFVAANIAGANPMKTAWIACRMGAVLAFIPFFYVLQPSLLIIYTPWWQTLIHFAQAFIGVWLLSSGLAGYLVGAGELKRVARLLLILGGFSLAFPQPAVFGAGVIISLATISITVLSNRAKSVQIPKVSIPQASLAEDER